jgi:hypothetical protein
MPSIDDVFSGDTLKASDIKGREPTVTIKEVSVKQFTNRDGKPQNKLVISFHKASKALVCNKTNAQRIAFLHGKDYTQWPGKNITLFVDPFVQVGHEMVEAVRVKPATGKEDRITTSPYAPGQLTQQAPFNDPVEIDDTF